MTPLPPPSPSLLTTRAKALQASSLPVTSEELESASSGSASQSSLSFPSSSVDTRKKVPPRRRVEDHGTSAPAGGPCGSGSTRARPRRSGRWSRMPRRSGCALSSGPLSSSATSVGVTGCATFGPNRSLHARAQQSNATLAALKATGPQHCRHGLSTGATTAKAYTLAKQQAVNSRKTAMAWTTNSALNSCCGSSIPCTCGRAAA